MRIDPNRLGFDIDGVVADTMHLFLDIAREDFNIPGLRYEDITCYMLEECLNLEEAVIESIVVKLLDGSRDAGLRPIPGAPEVLKRLGADHGPVRFVTARPDDEAIREWMHRIMPLPPSHLDIVATGSFEAKATVLREKGVSHFVEDRLETCFLLQEEGLTPILFKQPWNREPHPFVEVEDWNELAALIDFPDRRS